MDANGGNLIRLTNNGSNDDHPRWSPNGTKILFQSDRDNPDTGNQDIYVMNADGTGQTRLTTDAADDCNAVWSPDGTKIVFQSLRNGTYYQVYLMNSDGTSQLNKSNGAAADYQPSWSPIGSKIAFASERDHTGAPSVYSMNVDGSNQTRLTFSGETVRDEQPSWSGDAAKIAFVSTRDGNKEVYVMTASGGNQVRLTNTLENDDSPNWSPDGTQIVFRSERERDSSDPIQQLWMMNADGNNQALLAGNSFGDYSPSWTVSGNQPPVASSGGPYSGVIGQNVPFSAAGSFDPDGSINSYSWNFGDGGTASGMSPTHSYVSAGTYTVTLTVTDNLAAQTGATTTTSVTTAASEQYVANFNQFALARGAYTNESSYWNDILRAAYPNGQSSMLLVLRELGKTLFESNDYAARNRDNHWYVYDLYKTYLMREPDAPGWAFWENELTLQHLSRENLRRDFGQCTEFTNLVATLTPSGSPSSAVSSLASARVDPFNQPGSGLTARDAEWSVPLLSLPGRASLDLGLSLSYSSMIWTRSGPYIYFDEDNGWPSPGFRLGFPAIQEKYFDAQAGKNVYVLISGGSRVSLRQLGTSNVYEAADSSYLQLIDNGGSLLVGTTDGTQLSYQSFNSEWRCTQIKDRNGNYITVNYDWLGHIANVVDTLARTITFNYDTNNNLLSITQTWAVNGAPTTHTWASFGWTTKTIQPSLSGVMVVGANPSTIPVINQVGLDDGSHYTFEYNSLGQVNPIRSYRSDNVQRAYTAYDYDSPADNCPRLIDTHTWAENWTGINGVPQEVATIYGAPGDGSHTVTTPDGTLYKEFYGSSWQRGLTTQTEVWSGGVRQKWTTNAWTQDNTGVSYQTNPRVTETNIFDAGGNRRRTTVSYASFVLPSGASCPLPSDTREYAGDASSVLRRSHVDYRMDPTADGAYLSRHIVGLVKEQTLFEVNGGTETLMSKIGLGYDETGSLQGNDAPVSHDNSYDSSFVAGRANLTSLKRYDITDVSQFTMSGMKYNTAGAVVDAADPQSHHTLASYADSFADGNNSRNTLAYPKTVTDADGYSSTIIYNFDFGGVTSKQTPQPNTTANLPGPVQIIEYDTAGRTKKVTSTTNGAYMSYVYGPNYLLRLSTVNNIADEAYSNAVFDGLGRTVVAAGNHPGSAGGYSAVNTIYDAMGGVVKQSNPTETTAGWLPTGDDNAGWHYTQQSYDWKGRPLVTINTDGTTKIADYTGCGCAGGEVVTLTDEGTIDGGGPKRRQQRIHSDVLGRTVKTETLNWQGGDPYSTSITNYNARDQVTRSRQFDAAQGTVPSDANDLSCPAPSCQQTISTYDGYGRLKTKHVPEQDENTFTTYNYNPDETPSSVVDARGASQTFGYNNNRRLVTGITYTAPEGIPATPNVSFAYDAVGNRTSMSDGLGSVSYVYDQLSRLSAETRTISGLGTYPLNYTYNLAGAMTSVTDPFGAQIQYNFDGAGRVANVSGSGFGGVSAYTSSTSNIQYRAWGGQKSVTYGDGKSATTTYDARMRPLTYDILGLREQFQYYDDGRLKQMTDLDDRNQDIGFPDTGRHFSRARSYDQAGRLTSDKGTTSSAFPLNQNYAHDAFNNLTTRYGTYYYQNQTSDSATYSNNRRQNWTYHADGQVKHSPLAYDVNSNESVYRDWSYDAAGKMVQVQETVNNPISVSTYTTGYDGDGQPLRESTTTSASTTTGYMIRSSVLGGVVTRLDSAGAKQKTVFNVDGRLTAVQLSISGSNSVIWTHIDPLGLSEAGDTKPVYDALGSYVPWQHVPSGAPPNAYPPFSPNFGGLAPSFGYAINSSCILDGIPTDCAVASRMLALGSAEQCPDNYCGASRARNGNLVPLTRDPATGLLGYFSSPKKKSTEPKVDPQVVKQAVQDCITELYGKNYSLVDFKATQKPKDAASGDEFNGVTTIKDNTFGVEQNIVSDPTPPPDAQAAMVAQGLAGATASKNPWNPWWGFVRYGRAKAGATNGDLRYPKLFGRNPYLGTQIHELGVALSELTNHYHPNDFQYLPSNTLDPKDHDNGPQFEDCVGQKVYAASGLTPGK
jgi:YD repeat-containing protein